MAKLSGPEEFFEVFSDKQARQSSGDRPAENLPVKPRGGRASREGTVTIQVRTLAIGCACAVLLIVLSYFVGLSHRTEARPLGRGKGLPPGNGGSSRAGQGATMGDGSVSVGPGAGAAGDDASAGGAQATAPRKAWVLKVASYVENQKNKKLAAKLQQYVEENVDVAAYVFPYVTDDGRHRVVCIGPFKSKDDLSAVRVKNVIGQLPPYEGVDFKEARFGIISRPPR